MKVKDKIYKRLITNLTAFCGILILCSTNTAYAELSPQYYVTDAGVLGVLEEPDQYQVVQGSLNTFIKITNGTTAASPPAATAAVASEVLSIFLKINRASNNSNNGAVNSKFN
ncbi:MAG: hypothetical protein SGJ02_07920 [bacterium]|nr:hypothetical protein [bacterium]